MANLFPVESWVRKLELVDRLDHRDADGGGEIVRVFYVEPYSSYPAVIAALKGTVKLDKDAAGGETWKRVPPSSDPTIIKQPASQSDSPTPFFYCTDTKVTPFAREAVRASRSKGFKQQKTEDEQFTEIRAALNKEDDFDFAGGIDNLSLSEIRAGGPDYSGDSGKRFFTSRGDCGALIVATYQPFITVDWPTFEVDDLSHQWDPWDWVDPQWTPVYRTTMLGDKMSFLARQVDIGTILRYGGMHTTASVVETIWEFTCKRKFVPFIPKQYITALNSHINKSEIRIGTMVCPKGTVRMENPRPRMMMAADGQRYFDIDMKLSVRTITDEYYDVEALPAGGKVHGPIDWNHYLGVPTSSVPTLGICSLNMAAMSYWPVGWKTDVLPPAFGGSWRYWHLYDEDEAVPDGAGKILQPFNRGFKATD